MSCDLSILRAQYTPFRVVLHADGTPFSRQQSFSFVRRGVSALRKGGNAPLRKEKGRQGGCETVREMNGLLQNRDRSVPDALTRGARARWWRRRGSKRRGFQYVDAHGAPISEEIDLARIRALVIPPAWREVRIAP